MSHHSRKTEFKFSFQVLVRWLIFLIIIYIIYNFLSSGIGYQKKSISIPNILGDSVDLNQLINEAYQKLPPKTKQNISTLPSSPLIKELQNRYAVIVKELNGFPQKQINDLKRSLIQSIYQDLMKRTESP